MSLDLVKAQLEEELDRKKRTLETFKEHLNHSPVRGKLLIKKIRNSEYYYIRIYDEGRIKLKLIGKTNEVSTETKDEYIRQSNSYFQLKNGIKELKQDISKLEKVVSIL